MTTLELIHIQLIPFYITYLCLSLNRASDFCGRRTGTKSVSFIPVLPVQYSHVTPRKSKRNSKRSIEIGNNENDLNVQVELFKWFLISFIVMFNFVEW